MLSDEFKDPEAQRMMLTLALTEPKIARHAICRGRARSQKAGNWFGLFHRDPKRIVGVLGVTTLN